MELTYYRKGDYLFPNLTIENEPVNIGSTEASEDIPEGKPEDWYQSMC